MKKSKIDLDLKSTFFYYFIIIEICSRINFSVIHIYTRWYDLRNHIISDVVFTISPNACVSIPFSFHSQKHAHVCLSGDTSV